jgi:hypothetical protein
MVSVKPCSRLFGLLEPQDERQEFRLAPNHRYRLLAPNHRNGLAPRSSSLEIH